MEENKKYNISKLAIMKHYRCADCCTSCLYSAVSSGTQDEMVEYCTKFNLKVLCTDVCDDYEKVSE
jgi:hypothetical protein